MSPGAGRAVRILIAGSSGAVLGLLVGLVAIAIAPNDGFGDLAAAAVTTVFLVPLGLIVGGAVGWWSGRPRPTDSSSPVVSKTH